MFGRHKDGRLHCHRRSRLRLQNVDVLQVLRYNPARVESLTRDQNLLALLQEDIHAFSSHANEKAPLEAAGATGFAP